MEKNQSEKIRVYISEIAWDTDGEEIKTLPKNVTHFFNFEGDEEELADNISDWLSNEYGFCHMGFKFKYSTKGENKK